MEEFEIVLYKKEDGTIPVQEFLDSLDDKMQVKVNWTIDMLKSLGYELREPYSKMLNDGILELRAKVGNDITRVLYFFVVGRTAVLTNGFVKKSQKTSKAEIELAKKYRDDYLKREGKDRHDKL